MLTIVILSESIIVYRVDYFNSLNDPNKVLEKIMTLWLKKKIIRSFSRYFIPVKPYNNFSTILIYKREGYCNVCPLLIFKNI